MQGQGWRAFSTVHARVCANAKNKMYIAIVAAARWQETGSANVKRLAELNWRFQMIKLTNMHLNQLKFDETSKTNPTLLSFILSTCESCDTRSSAFSHLLVSHREICLYVKRLTIRSYSVCMSVANATYCLRKQTIYITYSIGHLFCLQYIIYIYIYYIIVNSYILSKSVYLLVNY